MASPHSLTRQISYHPPGSLQSSSLTSWLADSSAGLHSVGEVHLRVQRENGHQCIQFPVELEGGRKACFCLCAISHWQRQAIILFGKSSNSIAISAQLQGVQKAPKTIMLCCRSALLDIYYITDCFSLCFI